MSNFPKPVESAPAEGGAALLVSMNVIVVLTALAAAFLVVSYSENREHAGAETSLKAFYIAEAGLSDAVASLESGGDGNLGSPTSPMPFNGGGYSVETRDNLDGTWTCVARASYGASRVALEGVVATDPDSKWVKSAAFGDASLDMIGNSFTDSYDSGAGTYLGQATNNTGGRPHAGTGGDVESNGPVTFGPNSAVFGDVIPGPGFPVLAIATFISGATAPRTDAEPLPQIVLPAAASLPASPLTVNAGVNSLGPGRYHYTSLDVSGTGRLTITGPATIVAGSVHVGGNAAVEVDSTGGPVYFYVTGSLRFDTSGSVYSTTKSPFGVMFFVTTDNITGSVSPDGQPALPILLTNNAYMIGVLYAPNGVSRLEQSAAVMGSVAGRKVRLKDNASIHYDEILGQMSLPRGQGEEAGQWTGSGSPLPGPDLTMVSWRKVAPGAPLSPPPGGGSGEEPTGSDPPIPTQPLSPPGGGTRK